MSIANKFIARRRVPNVVELGMMAHMLEWAKSTTIENLDHALRGFREKSKTVQPFEQRRSAARLARQYSHE